jgi:ComF family protein
MHTPAFIRAVSAPVADLILPPRCWADDGAAVGAVGLSEATQMQIARLAAQPYCLHCGLTVGPHELHDARDPCGRCGQREVGVIRIARVGTFSEPLVTLVHRLKFGRAWEIARVLAPFVYRSLLQVSERTEIPIDALVPVPLHWRRRAQRGFNQAKELAREVAALSGWHVRTGLRRCQATQEQAQRKSATARVENLRGAFAPRWMALRGGLAKKHVWLVDDVSTTGATLHAAATALRKLPAGKRPASINAAVLCVTDHFSPEA